jgi:hypothetical protein
MRTPIHGRLKCCVIAGVLLISCPWAFAQDAPGEAQEAPVTGEPATDESATDEPATDEPARSPEETKAQAAEKYTQALQLYDEGLYAAALEAFKAAQRLYQSPINIYNIAKCYEKLGDGEQCVGWYERYLESFKTANDGEEAPDAADVNNVMDKCRLGLNVEVTIESEPSRVMVAVDDPSKILGQTPYKTKLSPGAHTLYLRADENYKPLQKEIMVKPGEAQRLVFKLDRVRTHGKVRINANIRGASIFIDGRNVGLTPYVEEIELSVGPHQIILQKDDYIAVTRQVDVGADVMVDVEAELYLENPPSTWKKSIGATCLVLGGLGVVGGLAYGEIYPYIHGKTYYEDTPEFDTVQLAWKLTLGIGGGMALVGITLLIIEAVDKTAIKDEDQLATHDGALEPSHTRSTEFFPVISVTDDGGIVGAKMRF